MLKATLVIASFTNTSGVRLVIEKTSLAGANVTLVDLANGASGSYSGEFLAGESVKVKDAGGQSFSIPFSGVITNSAALPMAFNASVIASADAAEVTASYSGSFTAKNDRIALGPVA